MAERETVSIVWHEVAHHVDVIYVDRDPERRVGTEMCAAEEAPESATAGRAQRGWHRPLHPGPRHPAQRA